MRNEDMGLPHPSDNEILAYLEGKLEGEALRLVEAHLARCSACRREVADAKEILKRPRRVRWPLFAPAAAAAAVALLFLAWPAHREAPLEMPVHRETPAELEVVPILLSPLGDVAAAESFGWTRVAGADRYRLTLYDSEGVVKWRGATVDSLLPLPDSVALEVGTLYLWKVEARVGWDVWESSDLAEFRLDEGASPSSSTGDPS